MGDSILKKYGLEPKAGLPSSVEPPEDDIFPQEGDAYLAYRPGSKVRRLMVLQHRRLHRAPGYQYLVEVMWEEDGTRIGLVFSHATVLIRGRNLGDLARQLAMEKVQFIQEFNSQKWKKPTAHEPIIESIEYVSRVEMLPSNEDKNEGTKLESSAP